MTLFWVLAAAIPLAAAAGICWPLLRAGGMARGLAVTLLALLPVTTVLLYQGVGAPQGLGAGRGGPQAQAPAPAGGELPDLVAELRQRLESQPDDLEGWMLLGRSYKTLQRYPEALEALRRARAIAPGDPHVAVELAEALVFTSADTTFGDEMRSLLEQALATDPQHQKGLWLKGLVAFQDGDYEAALSDWERLSSQLDPGSGVALSVAQQMDEARRRLGLTTVAWPGLAITVTAPEDHPELPEGASLFVIARQSGGGGPPLGAVRVPAPRFPVSVRLDDGASMLPQRPVSSMERIEVVARLSLGGQPAAAPGDWESPPVAVTTAETPELTLQLSIP